MDNDANRYTYAKGSTAGGLVIYEDKYAYSNHSTDPTGQMLCNAYDLVRLHLWPDATDSESNDFMLEMMQKDDLTRKQLAKDKQNEIQHE